MSRLDSMIRRLSAQRDCLNFAVAEAPAGDFLEVGLGNGRTYNHLREVAPDRRIWVVDRQMKAHPSSVPPDEDFLQGEADAMLSALSERIGKGSIAMAHYDLGIGVEEQDTPLRALMAPLIADLLQPGAVLVANQPMPDWEELPLPEGIAPGRYALHRR